MPRSQVSVLTRLSAKSAKLMDLARVFAGLFLLLNLLEPGLFVVSFASDSPSAAESRDGLDDSYEFKWIGDGVGNRDGREFNFYDGVNGYDGSSGPESGTSI